MKETGIAEALHELHMLFPSSYKIQFGAADAWREGHCPDHWVVDIWLGDKSAWGSSRESLTDAIRKAVAEAREKQ